MIEPGSISQSSSASAVGRTSAAAADHHEKQITFSSEIVRKTIHLGSLSIPVVYSYISRDTALAILLPLTVFSLFIDVSRHYVPAIAKIVNRVFDRILRPHERTSTKILLSGATYVLISALVCVFLFPKLITITAFSILIVSDASSALIGRAFGKHRFFDKSVEGTTAFIVSAWIVILLTPKAVTSPAGVPGVSFLTEYLIAAFAAVVGGIAEAASVRLHLDDNFSVPVSIGGVMWGLYYLLAQIDPSHYAELYRQMILFS